MKKSDLRPGMWVAVTDTPGRADLVKRGALPAKKVMLLTISGWKSGRWGEIIQDKTKHGHAGTTFQYNRWNPTVVTSRSIVCPWDEYEPLRKEWVLKQDRKRREKQAEDDRKKLIGRTTANFLKAYDIDVSYTSWSGAITIYPEQASKLVKLIDEKSKEREELERLEKSKAASKRE